MDGFRNCVWLVMPILTYQIPVFEKLCNRSVRAESGQDFLAVPASGMHISKFTGEIEVHDLISDPVTLRGLKIFEHSLLNLSNQLVPSIGLQ